MDLTLLGAPSNVTLYQQKRACNMLWHHTYSHACTITASCPSLTRVVYTTRTMNKNKCHAITRKGIRCQHRCGFGRTRCWMHAHTYYSTKINRLIIIVIFIIVSVSYVITAHQGNIHICVKQIQSLCLR